MSRWRSAHRPPPASPVCYDRAMAAPKTRRVTFTLPEDLAHEAERLGLLSQDKLAAMVEEAAQRVALAQVLAARDAGLFDPPMTYEEVEQEIEAVRAERAERTARSA